MGEKEHAWYAYQKYIQHYPDGTYVERAKQLFELAQNGGDYPEDMEPITFEPEKKSKTSTPIISINIKELYQKAEDLRNQSNIAESIKIYKTISEVQKTADMEESKIIEASLFYLGDGLESLEKTEEAIQAFSSFPTRFPKAEKLKESIYRLALLNEKTNNKEKAISLYKKVITLPPEDDITQKSQSKVNELEG